MTIIRSINLKCKFFSKNTIREDVNHVKHQNLSSTEMIVMQLVVSVFFGKYSYQFLIEEICQKCIYNNNKKPRSEEHTSELQSRGQLVCRLLLEKKKTKQDN